jgi:putative protein-disulfide isomerase
MNGPVLWYFADPMCSWCWGFTPVIEALRESHRTKLKIALVLGGLRSDTVPQTPAQREEILHHWHDVQARCGQTFRFEHAMPEGFVYDTEPASRAVLAAGSLAAENIFPMFRAIQSAFYTEGRDVTQGNVLAGLAAGLGLERSAFQQAFDSDDMRGKTLAHFRHARQAGVRGFPTLILQQQDKLHLITHGWLPLAEVGARLDARLDETA